MHQSKQISPLKEIQLFQKANKMEEELLPSFLNTTRIFKTQIDIDDKIKELNSDLTDLEEKLVQAK